jgi:hypothetical protein
MKKEIEVCDLCEEKGDEMFKCLCGKVCCEKCIYDHLREEHLGNILDEAMNDWVTVIKQ